MPSTTIDLISRDARVRPATGQVSTDLGGEVAILHIESGKYFALSPVGARAWGLLKDVSAVGDILEVLLDEFDVDAAVCERDLIQLLRRLEDRELVEISRGQAET